MCIFLQEIDTVEFLYEGTASTRFSRRENAERSNRKPPNFGER
jgi:hypothetical protein